MRQITASLLIPLIAFGLAGSAAPPTTQLLESKSDDALIKFKATPLTGGQHDHDPMIEAMVGARRILLGESTHGTHEYYLERAVITERLAERGNLGAIAIEANWTPTQRVNPYVRGLNTDRSAAEALQGFTSFPRWMWRNTDFRDFVERLRSANMVRPPRQRIGLYGMDVYDMHDAADEVVKYLDENAPSSAARARASYRCFARYRSGDAYGTAMRRSRSTCEDEARGVLEEVRRIPRPADPGQAEAHFGAVRAAASVVAAEAYNRAHYAGSLSWNIRDRHMMQNVEEIADHAERLSGAPRQLVIWSHNTHSGDARATSSADRGEINIGQLMKERHGAQAFAVGFFSYSGTVMAAPEWGAHGRVYRMRAALPGSYSELFHRWGTPAFSLILRGNDEAQRQLASPLLERAIGVVYSPSTERLSHYFEARLAGRFDAAIFFDQSTALKPI